MGHKPRIAIVGAGRWGTVLANALHRAGYPVRACASRTPANAIRLAGLVAGCHVASTASEAADRADIVFMRLLHKS